MGATDSITVVAEFAGSIAGDSQDGWYVQCLSDRRERRHPAPNGKVRPRVLAGNYGPLTAFDANTGAIKWTGGDDGAYASPIIVDLDGTRQVVSVTQQHVIGVSVADGTRLWQHPWRSSMPAITPILYGETIIVSGYGMGVAALKPTRRDGKWVTDVVWETKDSQDDPAVVSATACRIPRHCSPPDLARSSQSGVDVRVLPSGETSESRSTSH